MTASAVTETLPEITPARNLPMHRSILHTMLTLPAIFPYAERTAGVSMLPPSFINNFISKFVMTIPYLKASFAPPVMFSV